MSECKRDILGERWTICGAPGDGPCYCDVVVRKYESDEWVREQVAIDLTPLERLQIEYATLIDAYDAALDRIDELTEQRNALLGALLNMLYHYETGHADNPEIKRARAAVASVLGENFDTALDRIEELETLDGMLDRLEVLMNDKRYQYRNIARAMFDAYNTAMAERVNGAGEFEDDDPEDFNTDDYYTEFYSDMDRQ